VTLQTFNANDLLYTISPETDAPAGQRIWALLQARLLDEMTGQPPLGAISIESSLPGLNARVAPGGIVGFAGVPLHAFPQLAAQGYTVPVVIQAQRYITVLLNAPVAQILTFPNTFAPTDLGVLQMHRLPTVLTGRVVLNTGIDVTPLAGATVTLTGLWRTPPPANLNVPPDPPDVVALKPALYFGRSAAGAQLIGQDFQGVAGPDKQLLQDANANQVLLRLSDRKQIANGDILAIDPDNPERSEYIPIQSIAGASTDDQPATVTLSYPLQSTHRRGVIVHKVQFQQVGIATPLAVDAIAGDTCVFLNAVNNLGAANLVVVQGGGGPTEYHAVSRFNSTSDAQGFFRLPPISRIAQCGLRAHHGAHPDLDVKFSPDYSNEICRLDFVYQ